MLIPRRRILSVFLIPFLALAGSNAWAQSTNDTQNGLSAGVDLTLPAPIEGVLFTQEFELETGFQLGWPPNGPLIRSGTIVIYKADPALTVPRQSPTPILYTGDQVVHVLNTGQGSGVLIGIVPQLDVERLTDQPAWFGPPRLTATIDEKTIAEDRRAALEAGIQPNSRQMLIQVNRDALRARDLPELLRGEIAELVLEFAPEERSLAAKWRLPEVGEVKGRLRQP